MSKYQMDLRDLYFNLFEHLQVQDHTADFEEGDLKGVVEQFNKFVDNEVFPTRESSDHIGVKLTEKGVVVPEELKKAHEQYYNNGWFGLGYKEDQGGMPVPNAITSACTSLLNCANVSFAMYPGLTSSALNCMLAIDDSIARQYIEGMMSGSIGGTMCLTESGAGSDVGALRTTAVPSKDGKYNIKGVKIFISSGENDLYENIIHLVLARTPGAPEGTKGISLFVVPRYKVNDDGSLGESNDVRCTKIEEKMGLHAQATCELTFGANDNCEGILIGNEFEGMKNMFVMMNEARLLCGLQGESQGFLAYSFAKQYSLERGQFGTEIVNHPDVKRMVLKMRAMARSLRAICLYTADLFDHESEEGVEDEIGLLTPICKAYCSDEGFQICVDSIQVHGGYGYCTEYGVEQFARDAKIATIYEGTNGIQAIDFLNRKILRDEGAAFKKLMEKMSKASSDTKINTSLYMQVLGDVNKLTKKLSGLATSKSHGALLENATDFLNFCSNLVAGWRLLESAKVAEKKLDDKSLNESERSFYQSKLDDFLVFQKYYLARNLGLAHTIGDSEEIIHNLEV